MAGYFLYIEEASEGSASDDFEGIEWRKYVKKRLLFIISILFLVTLLIPFRGKAAEIDSRIEQYNGRLEIHQDNTATFIEEVTYVYDDPYNGQYITLGQAGKVPSNFEIESNPLVEIETNGKTKEPESIEEVPLEDGKKLKIYNSGNSGDRVKIKITWQLKNLLFLYPDVAELNWIPISDWEVGMDHVSFVVTSQPDSSARLVAHTGFFKKDPEVKRIENGFEVTLDSLGAKHHFELHGIWDRSLFSQSLTNDGGITNRRAGFEKQEQDIVRKTAFYQNLIYRILPVAIVVIFVVSIYYLIRYFKTTRQKTSFSDQARLYEVPQDLPPMLVALNIYDVDIEKVGPVQGKKGRLLFSNLIQATLLDLVDRGNLKYVTEGQSHRLEIVDYEGMAGFELTFVEMVFGDESSVEPDTMFSAYQIDKKILKGVKDKDDEAEVRKEGSDKRYRFIKDLRKLSNDIKEEEQRLGLHPHFRSLNKEEEKMRNRGCLLYLFVFLLLMFSLIGFGFLFREFFWQYSLGFLLVLIIGIPLNAFVTKRSDNLLNEDFIDEVVEWRSFANMLRDIAKFDKTEVEGVILWNRLLVYATLFGYAKRVSKVMKVQDIHLENEELERFVLTDQSLHFAGGVDLLNSYVQTASSASTFSISSGSDSGGFDGGGFSGGGGGGGGGSF